MAESSNNAVDALLALVQSQLLDVNTCLPGQIVSYSGGVASVVPTCKKRFADGDTLDYPIIPNVRVCWPSFAGGSAGIRGPVKKGDNCLLVFSQQAVDGSDDRRMFDLQDAYAIMCNVGVVGASDSVNDVDMTMYFGSSYIRLTEGGALLINAPGGITIASPETEHTGNIVHTGGTLSSNGIVLSTHTHGGVQSGASSTGEPEL